MRPLDNFLDTRLIVRAQTLRRLTARLWESLPLEFQGHVSVVGCDAGILSVLADSPAWATRLRFVEPQLMQRFAQGDPPCRRLRVIVRPERDGERPAPRKIVRQPISKGSASALATLADSIEDPALSAALRRLLRHAGGAQE